MEGIGVEVGYETAAYDITHSSKDAGGGGSSLIVALLLTRRDGFQCWNRRMSIQRWKDVEAEDILAK